MICCHKLTNEDRNGPAYASGFEAALQGKDNYRNNCTGNPTGEHNYYAGFMAGMKAWEAANGKHHPGR